MPTTICNAVSNAGAVHGQSRDIEKMARGGIASAYPGPNASLRKFG